MTDKNKELHAALFDLETELNGLKAAKQQIEEVIAIGTNVVRGFEGINRSFDAHLEDLGADYQSKLVLLQHTSEELKAKHNSFSEELKELSRQFIKTQTETAELTQNELVASTKSLIDDLVKTLDHSISSTNEVYQNQHRKINEQLEFYNDFVSKVEQLTSTIGNVNFPNRLDKLDNTVSAINIGMQNNQAKLDSLESSIRKELNDTALKINQGFEKLETTLQTKQRNTMIAIGFGVVIGLIILLKLFL